MRLDRSSRAVFGPRPSFPGAPPKILRFPWQARLCIGLWGVVLAIAASVSADEGMWLINGLPQEYLQKKYGFTPTDEWVRHVMLSSVRFNSGGSAAFVSPTGLVLTNHHVGADTLQKLSTSDRNYYEDGFLAKGLEAEIKAPDLELNQLVSIEDVTARVQSAVKPGMTPAESFAARRAIMAELEKSSLQETGLRSDVVTLYGGARYHLYRYRKYTDVRLVWAPEADIAFFGGDADNFEYPRYCLDVCLFRVYENGRPAQIEHFLQVSPQGVEANELVFVSGNPGRTQRIFTVAALKYQRDHQVPFVLNFLRRREVLFQQFGFDGEEQERRAREELFGLQNSRKAYTGMIQGLQDPQILAAKQAREESLRAEVARRPELQKYASAWDQVARIQGERVKLMGQTASLAGQLYEIANTLVFMAIEDQKPNAERLREFGEAGRESLLQQLLSPAPIYPDVETLQLADSLALFMERRGGDDPLVQRLLAGKSPQTRAAELVTASKLADVEQRRKLVEGGQAALAAATDPMLDVARILEPEARRIRKLNDELAEQERQAYSQIADAKFAVEGDSTYPDATFTLRLAFGPVSGYQEGSQQIAPWTTLGGAYQHARAHGEKSPWKLPRSWETQRDQLQLDTQFNFVCTADIIGGNSGSPVVNRKAELVGVIFDGNIQSLTANYFYSDEQSRAVSVNSAALIEALRKIYGAGQLADELVKSNTP